MDERALQERLALLEARLSRLEDRLALSAGESPARTPVSVPPPSPKPPPLPSQPRARSQVEWMESFEDLDDRGFPRAPPRETQAAPANVAGAAPVAPLRPPPLPRRKTAAAGTLETQVGLKWAGWVGAIIVVIGAALGIKYAYDQNWFGALPPAARLGLMSLGGFALLAAGEVVYRRIGAVASAGLFGAGVATLFVVAFAGYRYFDLYDREAAFAFMALVTVVGAAVAIRGNLVSIGTLSIVGGNVAPIALATENAPLLPFLVYLLMLQALALVLAWWGRTPKWWTLRAVAFVTLCLWMVIPVADVDEFAGEPRGTVLAFALLYAALFHLELVLTALRGPKPSTTRQPAFAVPVPLGWRDEPPGQRAIGVTFSLFVTAALTVAMLWLLRHEANWYRGAWTLGLAAACLGVGVLLPRLVRGRDPLAPPSPALSLGIGYRIQAAALVVVAVPVVLAGVWITVAWAVLALALAVAGASMNLAVSRAAAVGVWLLAAAHLGLWTLGSAIAGPGTAGTGPTAVWAVVFGQPIPAYFVMAAMLALAAHAIAAFIRQDWSPESVARQAVAAGVAQPRPGAETAEPASNPDGTLNLNYESRQSAPPRAIAPRGFQSLAAVTDVLGTIAFALAAFAALPAIGITAALLAQGWILIGLGYVTRGVEIHRLGLLLIALAAGKWLLYDTIGWASAIGRTVWTSYRPVYNPVAAVGAALLASAIALRHVPLYVPDQVLPRRDGLAPELAPKAGVRAVRALAGFAAVLLALWLVSVEVDRYFDVRAAAATSDVLALEFGRTKQVALSIVWSVFAVACVAAGFAMRVAGLRYFGLALFGITVGKVMLVDLNALRTGYRILSFLGLGLLLLGTSVLYGKLSPILLREPDDDDDDGGGATDSRAAEGGAESAAAPMSDSR